MRRPLRRWTALAAGVAAVAVLGPAAPAGAHAQLEHTDPAPDARLARSPTALTLRFDEPVDADLGALRLFDGRGRPQRIGSLRHADPGARVLVARLPRLGGGTYVASWRVTSADGHPVRGAFVFVVGEPSVAEPRGLLERVLARDGGDVAVGAALGAARAAFLASLLVLIGAVTGVALIWPRARDDRRVRRIVWWSLPAVAAAGGAVFCLHGPYAAGLGLGHVLDPGLWRDVAGTRTGTVTLVRLVLLGALTGLVRVLLPGRGPAAEHPLPVWWPAATGVVLVALAATPGFAGHAATGPWGSTALVLDAAHVLAAGVWLGGLLVLVAAILPRAPVPVLREVLPRWSNAALGAVAVVVGTGTAQSVRQLGTVRALVDSDYGRLLLVKIVVVLAVVVVAAMSRDTVDRWWRPARSAPVPEPALVGAGVAGPGDGTAPTVSTGPVADGSDAGDDDAPARRRLRRSVAVEAVALVGVVVLTALLLQTPPPRAAASGPFFETLRAGALRVDVTLSPARPGPNELHLYAFTGNGLPTDVVEMSASLSRPADGVEPIRIPLLRAGPGHYVSSGFTVPFAGRWNLEVAAVVDGTTRTAAETEVPVR